MPLLCCRIGIFDAFRAEIWHGPLAAGPVQTLFAVRDAQRMAKRMQINVEPGFTDIDSGINCGFGLCFGHFAFGTSSLSSVQDKREGPAQILTGSRLLEYVRGTRLNKGYNMKNCHCGLCLEGSSRP